MKSPSSPARGKDVIMWYWRPPAWKTSNLRYQNGAGGQYVG